jgi:DNA polymerase-4
MFYQGVLIMSSDWVACLWGERLGVAVERRRLPELVDEPVVLAAPDATIAVTSTEAEIWGITAGISVQGARGLCADLRVLPYDRLAYEIAARPLWDLIATESNVVEPVSPEVCYVEISGDRMEAASRIRRIVEVMAPRLTEPVRAGIGRSKFVALRAAQSRMAHGPILVPFGEEARFLAGFPLDTVPAKGRKFDSKSRQQLDRLGVRTLGDILSLAPNRLPKSLQRVGNELLQLAQGYDSDPVRPLWPPRALHARMSFTDESAEGGGYSGGVSDLLVIENRLVKMAEHISADLAATHEYAREISVTVGLLDGTFLTETERLAMPESAVLPLFRAAMRQFQRLQIEQPVVSLEVVAAELGAGSGVQLALMDAGGEMPHERLLRLEAAIAFLRKKHGPRVLIKGALLGRVRRIDLWTYSLARYGSEPLPQVAVDKDGNPVRYWRRGVSKPRRLLKVGRDEHRRYEVLRVYNRWRETGMRHGTLTDADVFRVETDPFGVSELRRLETDWRLTGTAD